MSALLRIARSIVLAPGGRQGGAQIFGDARFRRLVVGLLGDSGERGVVKAAQEGLGELTWAALGDLAMSVGIIRYLIFCVCAGVHARVCETASAMGMPVRVCGAPWLAPARSEIW